MREGRKKLFFKKESSLLPPPALFPLPAASPQGWKKGFFSPPPPPPPTSPHQSRQGKVCADETLRIITRTKTKWKPRISREVAKKVQMVGDSAIVQVPAWLFVAKRVY